MGTYLGDDGLNIDIVTDNRGIISTQFKGNPLESLCAASHDTFASNNGAGKGNLVNTRVLGYHRAEVIITTQALDNAWRKKACCQLCQFQIAVRREWRRFDDDGVSGVHSRGDFSNSQQNGEVPRNDGAHDAHRDMALENFAVVCFFNDVLWNLDGAKSANPLARHAQLRGSLIKGLSLFHC